MSRPAKILKCGRLEHRFLRGQVWLYDGGAGLRLGLSRSEGGKTVHIDVAFPVGAGPDVDSVQFSIEGKRGF